LEDRGLDGKMAGGCGVDSPGSGWESLGCCERGDEPSGSGATEFVGSLVTIIPHDYILHRLTPIK
jgi:hypothetical protein